MDSTVVAGALKAELAASSDADLAGATLAWPVPVMVFASACITVGILWDISWHATIGRDTFWTPAHLLIYLGGTLGGCIGGWLALQATFLHRGRSGMPSVNVLGARAPLGAWVAMWGAAAMLTSAPLDDWWHNAYGLDVKILSPPHALLATGMYGVVTGAVLLAAARRNEAGVSGTVPTPGLVIAAIGIQLSLASILLTELSFPNLQHTASFYLASAAMYPAFLTAAARFAPVRWAATKVSIVYMAMLLFMVWVLPWFPAEPKLAPIYNRVTHMVPPSFPLLLLAPALAIDLSFQGMGQRRGFGWLTLRIIMAATLFMAVFVPVQWYFAEFLISPTADHSFFAGHGRFMGYMAKRLEWRDTFWRLDRDPLTTITLVKMWLLTLASCGVGCAAGTFFRHIRR